jgi:ribosomal protein L37AE/L43A
LDLIERLTRDRRPLDTLIHAVSRAQQALHTAASRYTGPALTDPASGDQQQLAAALADTAVIAILGLHTLGRNTAGELAAAADRIDPWGAATRFREAHADGGWRWLGPGPDGGGAWRAPIGTPDPTPDQLAAAYAAVLDAGTYNPAAAARLRGEPQPAQEVPPALAAAACPQCQAQGLFVHAAANGWHECDACGATWALQ